MNITKQIQIFGDSIMRGVLMDGDQRYYVPKDDMVTEFGRAYSCEIDNRSKFGCTIEKGQRMLAQSFRNGDSYDMIVLEYGGNDCDFNWANVAEDPSFDHQPHTPIATFVSTYTAMIKDLYSRKIMPIVMSLPPIDAEKYFSWITRTGISGQNILKWIGDVQHIYRFQEMYSAAVTRLAYETKCLYVDVRSAFLCRRDFKELLCEDGIHPTAQGHDVIKEAFADLVVRYKANPVMP